MSNDPYQQQSFWTNFTKMLNEAQEYNGPLFCDTPAPKLTAN